MAAVKLSEVTGGVDYAKSLTVKGVCELPAASVDRTECSSKRSAKRQEVEPPNLAKVETPTKI